MDEAGAALDRARAGRRADLRRGRRVGPRARARGATPRRARRSAIQHGFIYRHWLNYLHEPDEMRPSAATRSTRAFRLPIARCCSTLRARAPRARRTLSRRSPGGHRQRAARRARRRRRGRRHSARDDAPTSAGRAPATRVVLLAAKFTEIGPALPALVDAAAAMPDLHARHQAASGRGRRPLRAGRADAHRHVDRAATALTWARLTASPTRSSR